MAEPRPEVDTPCVLWTGSTLPKGYGQRRAGGRWRLAHRVAFEATYGDRAGDAQLHHVCQEPRCINPDHLEPVGPTLHSWLHHGMSLERVRAFERRAQTATPAELAEEFDVSLKGAVRARDESRRLYALVAT